MQALILDDNPHNMVNQIGSSIPIIPYKGKKDEKDTQLVSLLLYLQLLCEECGDDPEIANFNKEHFNFETIEEAGSIQMAYDLVFKKKF